jgi:glucosaminylphosphatidylinositol acyltransferase
MASLFSSYFSSSSSTAAAAAAAAAKAAEEEAAYKAAKEAFVSHLTGTSIREIVLLTLPLPVALWAYTELKALRQIYGRPARGLLYTFGYEWSLLILPQVAAQLWPEKTPWVLAALLGLGVLCRAVVQASREQELKTKWRHTRVAKLAAANERNYVGNYRAGIMLTSTIAILAVDFPLFPRRLGKTEAFGTGLMDLGVGCFIFSSGLCSRAARWWHHRRLDGGAAAAAGAGVVDERSSPSLGPGGASSSSVSLSSLGGQHQHQHQQPVKIRLSKRAAVWGTTKRCIPLLILGLGRFVLNRRVDYHEHVSEYGVHWNFFLTLAAIQWLATLLHLAFPQPALFPLSLVIMVLYQMHLSLGGLADYVLRAPRPEGHFLAQNREGVLGVAGFLCLYLIGEQIGTWTIWRMGSQGGGGTKTTELEARAALWRLLALDGFLWAAALASAVLIQPISRRLVNMPYILWAAAHNVLIVALLVAVDQFASMAATSQARTVLVFGVGLRCLGWAGLGCVGLCYVVLSDWGFGCVWI